MSKFISWADLFNECNGIYVFDHDTTINYNSIRILRAQTYVRIAEFDNAELELLEVDDLLCESKNLSALECLDKISNYGYACTDGDGTIGMANDNNPSGAPPCNFNSEAVLSDNKKCIYADIGGNYPEGCP